MATLKSLVNETTNIKNEIVECRNSLKNKLIEKGVECDDSYRMLSLVNKVEEIKTYKKIAGEEKVYFEDSKTYSTSDRTQFVKLKEVEINEYFDSVRICYTRSGNTYGLPEFRYEYIRGDDILESEEATVTSGDKEIIRDVENVKKGDKVVFWGKGGYDSGYSVPVKVKNIKIQYSIELLD